MPENYENKRTYIYRRTSSPGQDTYLSPERQIKLEEAYTRREGLEAVEVFTDIGSGLDTENRASFLRMIDKAMDPANNVANIVVSDLSRFSREKTPQAWVEILLDHGITLHSTEEGKSTDDYAEDYWDSQFLENHRFSRRVSRDTIGGLDTSVKMGNYIGSIVPYGYEKYKVLLEGKERPRLKPHPEHSPTVKLIFEMKANGYSTMAILEYLNGQEIPSPKGKLWTSRTILNMLRNRVYLGYSIVGKTSTSKFPRHRRNRQLIECPNAHEPLVTEDVFYKVDEIIKKNTRTAEHSPRAQSSPNLLSERIKCGFCGANMSVTNSNKGKKLICATKKNSGKNQCKKKEKDLSELMEQIITELCLRILDEETVKDQIKKVQDEFSDELANEKKRQTRIATRIGNIEKKRSRLAKTISEFEQEYPGAIADLMLEISNLRSEQEILDREKLDIDEETKERMSFLTDPDSILKTSIELRTYVDPEDKEACRELLHYFIQTVDLYDDSGTIHYTLPLPDTHHKDGGHSSKITFNNKSILSEHATPAHTGIDLTPAIARSATRQFPHPRGDRPYGSVVYRFIWGVPPPTRG